MTTDYYNINNFYIHPELYTFIDELVTPGIDVSTEEFFTTLSAAIAKLAPTHMHLLDKRQEFERKINQWHTENTYELTAYKEFLTSIGYIEEPVAEFSIDVQDVDHEISHIAGPQLVVPISNERFAINALNTRFGSLYDALYGSNIIPDNGTTAKGNTYNTRRGDAVMQWSNAFLDATLPLTHAQYKNITSIHTENTPIFIDESGQKNTIADTSSYIGKRRQDDTVELLFTHHNLYIMLKVKNNTLTDVILESAITTIVDFEDSVATVSPKEKIHAYKNLLDIIKGDISTSFTKGNKSISRSLNANKTFITPANEELDIKTTSLMLIRNVGHHMLTELILDENQNATPEGILDAFVTCLISKRDIQQCRNSQSGSIYIVKPKMHGSEEVALAVELMSSAEESLDIPHNTVKLGIMDEEKRTSVNLEQCIHAAKERVIFVNTGFLDRTGDEIHTCMYAGAVLPKAEIKKCAWITAYESLNVSTALKAGFSGRAQIGKGMWAEPDNMKTMLEAKIAHLTMGANCSWVPSPSAATIHATHYHATQIFDTHHTLMAAPEVNKDNLLVLPLLERELNTQEIIAELRNNIQGILGYVSRWIMMGVGCSKVNDIDNIALMEDRATLRISSQHIANWLHHGICTKQQVEEVCKEMATLVDTQNAHDPEYVAMTNNYEAPAYKAALELIFNGVSETNGYTEFTLNAYRALELS